MSFEKDTVKVALKVGTEDVCQAIYLWKKKI